MGSTNKTARLQLSKFSDTDKPTWRGDYNGDMLKIDTAVVALDAAISTATNVGNTALGTANEAKAAATTVSTSLGTTTTSLTESIANNKTAIETTVTNNKNAVDASIATINTGLASRYTKSEADAKFAPVVVAQDVHAVFLGSSNSLPGQWCEAFAAGQGWVAHNYSVGGGSFTGSGGGRLDAQLGNALADTTYSRSLVKYVFICDCGNDIRAQTSSVASDSAGVFGVARSNYPNARIIMIPALWGPTSRSIPLQNTSRAALDSLQARISELKESALPSKVEIVEGSHTWLWDSASYMVPSEVHMTPSGYARIRNFMDKYMRGESTWNDTAWKNVTAVGSHDLSGVKVRRVGNMGQLVGNATLASNVGVDTDLFTLPLGMNIITGDALFTVGVVGDNRTDARIQVFDSGLVRAFSAISSGRVDINITYPIF